METLVSLATDYVSDALDEVFNYGSYSADKDGWDCFMKDFFDFYVVSNVLPGYERCDVAMNFLAANRGQVADIMEQDIKNGACINPFENPTGYLVHAVVEKAKSLYYENASRWSDIADSEIVSDMDFAY